VDLVNLATTASDAAGALRIAEIHYQRLSRLAKSNVTTQSEVELAAVNLENAKRKLDLLREMAMVSLRAAETEYAGTKAELEHLKKLYETGTLSQSAMLASESQLASTQANLELLKLILSAAK